MGGHEACDQIIADIARTVMQLSQHDIEQLTQ